ncbi:hypothetical protein BKA62DRAFT_369547 [Auriculariales sp. MPI-PUGE-AT-0066]|nr:hypothetical protein BKA62DRAFT_369547 [Auriculariales sp. MPI-PUGE-AT-0066]
MQPLPRIRAALLLEFDELFQSDERRRGAANTSAPSELTPAKHADIRRDYYRMRERMLANVNVYLLEAAFLANQHVPINRLPDDILITFFSLANSLHGSSVNYSRTCRRWFHLSRKTAALWAGLNFSQPDRAVVNLTRLRALQANLLRTRNAPLDITISLGDQRKNWIIVPTLNIVNDCIRFRSHRLRSLKIHARWYLPIKEPLAVVLYNAPLLERLDLRLYDEVFANPWFLSVCSSHPFLRLTHATLDGIKFKTLDVLPLMLSITHLSIRTYDEDLQFGPTLLRQILDSTPEIISLQLGHPMSLTTRQILADIDSGWQRPPHLKSVTFVGGVEEGAIGLWYMVKQVTASPLSQLRIFHNGSAEEYPATPIPGLLNELEEDIALRAATDTKYRAFHQYYDENVRVYQACGSDSSGRLIHLRGVYHETFTLPRADAVVHLTIDWPLWTFTARMSVALPALTDLIFVERLPAHCLFNRGTFDYMFRAGVDTPSVPSTPQLRRLEVHQADLVLVTLHLFHSFIDHALQDCRFPLEYVKLVGVIWTPIPPEQLRGIALEVKHNKAYLDLPWPDDEPV